jgi:hypothetical protein
VKRLLRTFGSAALVIGLLTSTAAAQTTPAAPPSGSAPAGAASAPPAGSAPAASGAPAGGAAPAASTPTGSAPPAAGAPSAESAPPPAGADAGATTAPTTAPGATPAADGTQVDGATYAVRLRDLEQRIDELKEQIRRSHTRLSLLSDTILSGGGAGSRSVIRFSNELSDAFRVTRLLFVLDGAVQYNKTDQSGVLSDQDLIPIFNGTIPPGDHTLQVLVNLQGHGYGVFSYLRGYRFEVRSSHSFTAVEGKTVNLDAVAYEKGGVTTPLEERPAIRYREKVTTGLADSSTPAQVPGAPAAPAP